MADEDVQRRRFRAWVTRRSCSAAHGAARGGGRAQPEIYGNLPRFVGTPDRHVLFWCVMQDDRTRDRPGAGSEVPRPSERAFVVQLSQQADPEGDGSIGRVELVASRTVCRVGCAAELSAFIARPIGQPAATAGADGAPQEEA